MGSGSRIKARVVLFVEDDADLRVLYTTPLRETGLYVTEVASVAEGIAAGHRLCPDLVVLNRFLGDGDGWEVARALKASARTRAAPILAFTASNGRGDVERALVAGCDAFLEKPCEPEQLVRFALGLLGLPLPEEESRASLRRLA